MEDVQSSLVRSLEGSVCETMIYRCLLLNHNQQQESHPKPVAHRCTKWKVPAVRYNSAFVSWGRLHQRSGPAGPALQELCDLVQIPV